MHDETEIALEWSLWWTECMGTEAERKESRIWMSSLIKLLREDENEPLSIYIAKYAGWIFFVCFYVEIVLAKKPKMKKCDKMIIGMCFVNKVY